MREGKAKRVRSRNHPEIDEGWFCDKGRFAFTHVRAADRIVDPIVRRRRRGFEPTSWDEALDVAEELLRAARGRIVTVLSGSETVEQAYALARLLREGLGSHQAVLPEEVSTALDAYRLPLSAIATPRSSSSSVTCRSSSALRWSSSGSRRPVARAPASSPSWTRRRCAQRSGSCSSGRGPGGRGGATVAGLAERLGLAGKPGCGAFYLPATPNGRGIADAWAAASDEETPESEGIGLLLVSGDEAAGNPNVRALAERAEAVIAISMFHGLAAGWADLVLPGTS